VVVTVDLPSGLVGLDGWSLLTSLVVLVDGGRGVRHDDVSEWRLAAVLGDAGVTGVPGTGEALIPRRVLHELAEGAALAEGDTLDDEWDVAFAGMLDDAASRGWVDDEGAIRAHVEWRDA
jgi:hypothetical protein